MAIPRRSSRSLLALLAFIALLATANLLNASTKSDSGTISPSPSSLNFGSVTVGQSVSLPITLTNTGTASVTITRRYRMGAGFYGSGLAIPTTLAAGQTVSFMMTFTPRSTGSSSGSLTIMSNASNPTLVVPLSGMGTSAAGSLVAKPPSLAFGSVQVGNSATLSETLTNSGSSSVTISQATTSGTGFRQQGLTVPLTLTAGQSVTFSEIFTPTTTGSASGSVSVVSNANPSTLSIPLSGNGTAAGSLAVSPLTLAFGNVTVGTSKSLPGTLTATGGNVVVSSGTSTSSEFVLSGLSFPLTVSLGQSVPFTVAFTPQSSGATAATLTFASNASNPTVVESLTGSGTAAPPHSVSLNWSASTSVVMGYNLYRGQIKGGPYSKLNSALDPITSYSDSSVSSGQTYYYVTTAVDSSGDESSYSNEVKAVIPTP